MVVLGMSSRKARGDGMSATSTSRVEQDFFKSPKPWSEIKHRVLSKYLSSYISIRKNSTRRIFFIDAYAGAGTYGASNEFKKKHYRAVIDQLVEDGLAKYGPRGSGTGNDEKDTRPITFFPAP